MKYQSADHFKKILIDARSTEERKNIYQDWAKDVAASAYATAQTTKNEDWYAVGFNIQYGLDIKGDHIKPDLSSIEKAKEALAYIEKFNKYDPAQQGKIAKMKIDLRHCDAAIGLIENFQGLDEKLNRWDGTDGK